MLKVGDKAPEFTLLDGDENSVSLSDFKGKKVVIWFYPKASTPGWTVEGKGFRDEFQNFESKNVQILGVSADPTKRQKKFGEKQLFQYPLLSDETHEMLEAYETWDRRNSWAVNIWGFLESPILLMKMESLNMFLKK